MKKILLLFIVAYIANINGAESGKTEIMNQGFEQKELFEQLSPNGYTSFPKEPGGQWGFFKNDKVVVITEEQAASGSRSLKYTAQKKTPYYGMGIFPVPVAGGLELELWINREAGFNYVIGLVSRKDGKSSRFANVGTFDKNHQFAFLDTDGKWKRSGIKCPAEEWVRLLIHYKRAENTCSYYVFLDDRKEEIGTCKYKEPVGDIVFFELRPNNAEPGSSIYLDNVRAFETEMKK